MISRKNPELLQVNKEDTNSLVTVAINPYKGQAGKNIKEKLKEHLPNYKTPLNQISKYAEHLIDENYIYSFSKFALNAEKGKLLNIIEKFQIYSQNKQNPTILPNDKLSFASNAVYDTLKK